MADSVNVEHETSLSKLFDDGLTLYNHINNNNKDPTNSPEFQADVKKATQIFEQCTRLVSLADIFSKNEEVEEIATNNLKYLLLPAFLGSLTLRITTKHRKDVINVAEIYFKDFLKRTNEYGLSNYVFKNNAENETQVSKVDPLESLSKVIQTRNDKIKKFKDQQEIKRKLEDLKKNMENENVDEEIKRNYFLTMVKLMIYEAVDELGSIEMEKPLLEHMSKRTEEGSLEKRKGPPPQPLKPIIITRDEVQKAVYGAGYPSLPTMTVQEFYDKRIADGIFPDPSKPQPVSNMSLQTAALQGLELNNDDKEEEEKEGLVEEDNEENLQRMRAMDEYKDEHRRGWGNRMNRS